MLLCKKKKKKPNALNQVELWLLKMENITFGAHVQNVELKKQDLSKTRETNSALSRRGHFAYGGINWGRSFSSTRNSLAWQKSC